MRHWIIGNGPSLNETPLDLLIGETTWAVNRIWKIFNRTAWRPTHYVRAEVPVYNPEHVIEDVKMMTSEPSNLWFQEGFRGDYTRRTFMRHRYPVEYFRTCEGGSHKWHLPLVCGYGTSVHIAMQLAVLQGASELCLLGCDLGFPAHFYGEEGFGQDEVAYNAHAIAHLCAPVRVYNCTIGGKLDVYPRRDIRDILGVKDGTQETF